MGTPLILTNAEQRELYMRSLFNLGNEDGREVLYTHGLRQYLSEGALYRYRAVIMIELLIALSEAAFPNMPTILEDEKVVLRRLVSAEVFDARVAAEYDHFGRNGLGPFEHDVKATEYAVRELLVSAGIQHLVTWLYVLMTSEDCNNLAWNLMLRDAVNNGWLPALLDVADKLGDLSERYASASVVGMTHSVKASSTTTGKRFSYALSLIAQAITRLSQLTLGGKFFGSVGNHNPAVVIAPDFDIEQFSRQFVESFGFSFIENVHQRNSHVEIVLLFDEVKRINLFVGDLCENIGRTILAGWLGMQSMPGHVGSSIMPQKTNDWRDEVAIGYFEQSNRMIDGAGSGLIQSVLERDASDHPWERAYGQMLGKSLAGLKYVAEALSMLQVYEDIALQHLGMSVEILSEVLQLAGRTQGTQDMYMVVKQATRGRSIDQGVIDGIINQYISDPPLKERLLALTPATYTGKATEIAIRTAKRYQATRRLVQNGVLDSCLGLEAVLFDFDGTLQVGDKEELHARFTEINRQMNLGFTEQELREFGNRSDYLEMRKLIVAAYKQKPGAKEITEEEFEKVNRQVSGTLDHHLRLAEYALDLLITLKARGVKVGLVTTRGANSLPRLLQTYGIGDYFDAIIDRTSCDERKPDPTPIVLALKQLAVLPTRAMYVGDKQKDDIIPGVALGMQTVLINDEELDAYGARPNYHVRSLEPLLRRFARPISY